MGIGETNPDTSRLHIKDTKHSAGDVWTQVGPGNNMGITIQNDATTDNTNAVLYFKNDTDYVASIGARFTNHSTNETELRFGVTDSSGNSREKMYLKGDGKLGIGTPNPSAPLEVVGNNNGITISAASVNRPHLRLICGSNENLRLSCNQTYAAIGDSTDNNRYMILQDGNVDIQGSLNVGDMRQKQWSTENMSACSLPYGGGNNTLLFYNAGGYGWMTGRIYYTLYISQVHRGILDFAVSRYGLSMTHHNNGSYVDFYFANAINGVPDHNGISWTNNNSNSWGNGTMEMTVLTNGGYMASAYGNQYTNVTMTHNNPFLKQVLG
jgi:hypothetical protein